MQSAAKKIGFASPNRQTEEGFEGKEEKKLVENSRVHPQELFLLLLDGIN